MFPGLPQIRITRPLAIICSDKDKWRFFLLGSGSLIHSCTFAFCHSAHLFVSLGHGSGWKILGKSTYKRNSHQLKEAGVYLIRIPSIWKLPSSPWGEACCTDADGFQDTTCPQLLHCPLLVKPTCTKENHCYTKKPGQSRKLSSSIRDSSVKSQIHTSEKKAFKSCSSDQNGKLHV